MQLTRFIKPLDFRVIFSNLCRMLRLYAGLLAVPFLVSLIAREFDLSLILGGMAAGSFILGNLKFFDGDSENLAVKEALAVTALAYLLFALIGAVAFLPVANFTDGFFEAMSGFTTTGLSVMPVDRLPVTLMFFRAYSQWIGGAGIIVLSLSMLVGPGKAASVFCRIFSFVICSVFFSPSPFYFWPRGIGSAKKFSQAYSTPQRH